MTLDGLRGELGFRAGYASSNFGRNYPPYSYDANQSRVRSGSIYGQNLSGRESNGFLKFIDAMAGLTGSGAASENAGYSVGNGADGAGYGISKLVNLPFKLFGLDGPMDESQFVRGASRQRVTVPQPPQEMITLAQTKAINDTLGPNPESPMFYNVDTNNPFAGIG